MKLFFRTLIAALSSLGFLHAANLTTTVVQQAGNNWNALIWKTNGTGTAVGPPVAGNTYEAIFNGVSIGNGAGNTRLRNPTVAGVQTFAGDSLMMDTNSELRAKQSGVTLDFPGVGGNPGLILNGGMLNGGDDATFPITGRIQVLSQSYISHGANGGGGGVSANRAFNFSGILSGTGNMVIMNAGTTIPQRVSNGGNTFSGQWIVQCGWLLGAAINSLGTNSITVDPLYNGYLSAMPNATSAPGPAWVEANYDLNSAGALALTNGGIFVLHQNCIFSSIKIEGVSLSSGTHYFPELAANFPANFPPSGSGSLTVQPYGAPPPFAPSINSQPISFTLFAGSPTQMVASASGTAPLSFQWQKGTNGTFVNATDTGDVSGSHTNALLFSGLTLADAADYRLVVTNAQGAATSLIATATVLLPDTNRPVIAVLNPIAGATVSSLSQIQITFSENVIGVAAEDILINGNPANSVSGSGSNYVFTFTQPLPGTILLSWDIESAISDQIGNSFDTSGSWTYTLADNIPPTIFSTAPIAGTTVSALTQAQVIFSEPVTGVDAADLRINGQPATNLTGSGFGPYTFQFSSPAQGTVNFSWAAGHNIRDLSPASNLFGSTGWSVTLDSSAASAAVTNIVINEFLAANISPSGLLDEDSQLDDWIEIYNRGATAVNLAGWSLTDNADQPTEWTFPATNIAAGQYLIVFASGKDRAIAGANLHANFSLNPFGEYLGLYNSDFPPRAVHEFAPKFPEQRNDYSYGFDDSNNLRYFSIQTPGGPNATSTITGVVASVHFSVNHGFFNQPFNLLLTTAAPGAAIIYTIDGSVPDISGGVTNGLPYLSPLNISNTTVLRAAAFAADLLPSTIGSQTYFFVEDIVHQPNNPTGYPTGNVWTPNPGLVQNGSYSYYQMDPTIVNDPQYSNSVRAGLTSIPSMSIIVPIPDLFDPNIGIYTHPQNRSVGWERACSMELVFPDGSAGAQIDCGLQIQGGTQRDPGKNAKHSFRVNFKGDYGSTKFNFPMFADSPIQSFNTFVLDGGINYWWNYVGGNNPVDQRYRAQCVRDQYASDLMLALGHPSFHGQFYNVYLNGLYWGLHYIHERPDEDFAASYFGGDSTDYDVIKNTTFGTQIVAGDLDAWNTVLALSNSSLTNSANYEQLQQYVDLGNLIDYMIVNHWIGNDDWPQHNWYLIRKRAPGEGFKFLIWDAEHVLKDVNENVTGANTVGSPAQVYNALRNNAEFRLLYADHIQKHFFNGGLFYTDPTPTNAVWDPAHPERNIPASYYMRRINEITNAIVDESARWGGYTLTTNYTRNNHWLRELNNLLGYTNNPGNTANYFPLRTTNVLNQYKALGLFPSVNAPTFSQQGGTIPIGFSLSMTNPNSGGKIYYTTNGTDPRVYGSGAVSLSAIAYTNPVVLNASTIVKARVLNGSWSALNEGDFSVALLGVPIRITEIMYNPIGGDAFEYIELQNLGVATVDLSRYSFQGITYVFPDDAMLAPGAVIVLASSVNPTAFAGRYPGVVVAGYYGDKLSNGGERIALLDQKGNTVISVDYQNSGGWPVAANGGGSSLEIINPNGDPDDPANWRASSGSPGIVNPVTAAPTIRFNEVMAENFGAVTNGTTTNSDWVELLNTSGGTVNLVNWSLSNSGNARKYVFASGTTIPANGYLVVWCDSQTNAPGLHSGFTLGRKGENLFLYDSSTNRVDAFSFGLQLTNYSVGRLGTTWQLTSPTPGAANVATSVGTATNLIINEWLANSSTGGSDWLELYNKSATLPVALSGLFLATSNDLFQIRSLSFIAPRDFVQLFADENPGFDHVDFKLTAGGDAIVLYDYSGQQVDRVSFLNQLDGISQGRFPNGSSTIVGFPGTASPGASNYVSTYTGPRLNELMARNNSAVYDSHGNNPDWVELFNPNPSTFNLAGMSLTTDPNNPALWKFPAGVTIPANSYLLVWCDSSRAPSTNSAPDLNTGFSLPGNGGGVYLFTTNSQLADSVTFGPQIIDLSIGLNGGTWNLLANPTPAAANASIIPLGNPTNLRVNEWMAAPSSGDDWFELYNSDSLPVNIAGLFLSDNPSITGMTNSLIPALSFVAGHGWIEYHADGSLGNGPDHVNFNLDKSGETIRVYSTNLTLIDAVDYAFQSTDVSQGRLPDGGLNIVNFPTTPTPEGSNYLPLQNVLVNEVLTHTDPPLEDAVEFYNSDNNPTNIGGWFMSNSETDFKRYRFPDGTTVSGHGYKVLYEYQFNGSNSSPFTLNSAHGDSVYLSQADGSGNLTGYRSQISFGAAEHGVSFGRFPTSIGVDFVAMSSLSFGVNNPANLVQFRTGAGQTNANPKVGPVVVNEIMYHPIYISGTNTSENTDEEYLELFNITSNSVPLYDPAASTNHWKISGAVDYLFPASVTLPPGGFALVAGFDPVTNAAALANFRTKYGLGTNISIYGPWNGHLNNSGETIQLFKPDPPQIPPHPDAGFVPYIAVESVTYSNALPWPAGADATGMSLQRRYLGTYANDPVNWVACSPNPGARNCFSDSDGDGLPDDWELANGFNPFSLSGNDGPNGDPDGDKFTNLQEFLAGTNPRDAQSLLKITSITRIPGGFALRFNGVAGHSYTVQSRNSLSTGSWQKVSDVATLNINSNIVVNDTPVAGLSTRFYRLVTPSQ